MFLTRAPLECVQVGGGAPKHCAQMVLCLGEGSQLPSDLQRHLGFLKDTETPLWGVRARLAHVPLSPLHAVGTKAGWPREVQTRSLKSSPHRGGGDRYWRAARAWAGGLPGWQCGACGRAPGCAFLGDWAEPPFHLPCL